MHFHARIITKRELFMDRYFTYVIDVTNHNCSIKEFLKTQGCSQPILVRLKKTPYGILLNGQWARVSDLLSVGDRLEISLLESAPSEHIVPVKLPLDIVFEDEDIVIVNKPAKMPTHPSLKNYDNTLANALAFYYKYKEYKDHKENKENKESSGPFVFRCLNRLDRDTTGLTIIAKHALSAAILSRDMKSRAVARTYYAIVSGDLSGCGTIDAPIGRVSDSIIARKVDLTNGQPAITHYKSLWSSPEFSYIQLQLDTGRTHQIRVHMQHIGHPLLGDFIYNPTDTHLDRQALHAGALSFLHPITREPLMLHAPLPDDMRSLLPECFRIL